MQPPCCPLGNDLLARTRMHDPCHRTARAGRSLSEVLVVLATTALVVLPVAIVEWPREMARWHQAAAIELDLQDDSLGAIASMDRAIAWYDKDPMLFLQRAQCKLHAQQWASGLEDCDRARQLAPDSPAVGVLRSQFLQHLGRHREAVAEWREIMKDGGSPVPLDQADELNQMAYTMAVGDVDLEEGLVVAERSLRLIGDVAAILDPAGVLCFGRAETARKLGDNELALTSLTEACEYAETALQDISRQNASERAKQDPRRTLALADELQTLRAHVAGILRLRASICTKLDKPEDAARDEQRIKELEVDGNLAIVVPYELETAIFRVSKCAAVLDTRGYLYYKLQELAAAREDLQRAVNAMQWVDQAMTWLLDVEKDYSADIRSHLQAQRSHRQSLAVILYHRALVQQAVGKQHEADQDLQKVRDLGYEPGEQLY
jgi:tetratricopeptide (TPR) repeat protein